MTKQDAPTTTDAERDRFLAWARKETELDLSHGSAVGFYNSTTNRCFQAWQAARASSAAAQPFVRVYRCTLMSRAAMKKAGQVGWFVDCAGGQTLEMREAVQSDLDRCNLGEDHSRDPADWMCEVIPHGALVARAAIVHTMSTDFWVAAPPAKPADTGEAP